MNWFWWRKKISPDLPASDEPNEVEQYLRKQGEWGRINIPVDLLGRAVQGREWHLHHYAAWLDAFPDQYRNIPGVTRLQGSCWCKDEHGLKVWVTDTPDFDRAWFRAQGVRPPRFGSYSNTYWKDYGGGLRGLHYGTPETASTNQL